jgi:hypothetical protein
MLDMPLVQYCIHKWIRVFWGDGKTVERVFWNLRQLWPRPLSLTPALAYP